MADLRITVGLSTYNRSKYLEEIINAILSTTPPSAKVVVSDDGSTDSTPDIVKKFPVLYIRGENKGAGYNKNRILAAGQDSHFVILLEDDIKPIKEGWCETYATAHTISEIHCFTRVQDKTTPETIPSFYEYMQKYNFTPIYSPHPRGDIISLTSKAIKTVGGFRPEFKGCGFYHSEHAARCYKAGLIGHPNRHVDIEEARDMFTQLGDTEGGRWEEKERIDKQLERNKQIYNEVKNRTDLYVPIVLE